MKIYNAMSNWGKILLFCLLFLILVVLLNTVSMRRKLKEGYEQRDNEEKGEKFILKEGNDIYDDFYISIYDDLFYSTMKDDYEIGQIINKTEPTSESRILDIGSGTGHHVSKLQEQGYNVIGLDASEAMVKKAKDTFPSSEFIVGDATGALNFQFNYFTHIMCMYFTIYHIKNKERFFTNVINWLMPGGYFILHLVDRENFDPILPAGQGFLIVSPQKYAKERITKTKLITLGIAFVGIVILNPFQAGDAPFGNFLALGNAVFFALLVVFMRMSDKDHTIGNVFWFVLFATIILLPFFIIFGLKDLAIILPFLPHLLILGFVSTGLAYLLYNIGLEHIEAEKSAIIETIFTPVFSIILAVIIISEELNPQTIIGGAILIFAGIYLQMHMRKLPEETKKVKVIHC